MEVRFKRVKDGFGSLDTTMCDSLEAAADHYRWLQAQGYAVTPYSENDEKVTEYWMNSDGVLVVKA